MPVTINGSPTHVLIVHLVVVLLPLSIIGALVLVAVPTTRRALSLLTLLIAFVACVAIPFAFLSGSKLSARVPRTSLVTRHIQLAHQLLPLAVLFGLVLAVFVLVDLIRRSHSGTLNDLESRFIPSAPSRTTTHRPPLNAAYRRSAGLLVILSVLTGIQTYRVGDAGAKASWEGRLSPGAASPIVYRPSSS